MIWQFKVAALCLFHLLSLIVGPVIQQEEDEFNRVISTVLRYLALGSLTWGLMVS